VSLDAQSACRSFGVRPCSVATPWFGAGIQVMWTTTCCALVDAGGVSAMQELRGAIQPWLQSLWTVVSGSTYMARGARELPPHSGSAVLWPVLGCRNLGSALQ
jgi:hypothetical protein